MSWPMHERDVVQSTMQEARILALQQAPHGTTVRAREQRAGRGRRGRVWTAPKDSGVLMTTLLRPTPQAGLERLSIVAGVAVWQALAALGAPVQLKWPNDVVANGRKVAGILLEADGLTTAAPVVYIGVGINWARASTWAVDFPGAPVGLQDLLAPAPPPAQVAATVLSHLQRHIEVFFKEGLSEAMRLWRTADVLWQQDVRLEVEGRMLRGVAAGLAVDGRLVVQTSDGPVHVGAGEVHGVRPQQGTAYSPGGCARVHSPGS